MNIKNYKKLEFNTGNTLLFNKKYDFIINARKSAKTKHSNHHV